MRGILLLVACLLALLETAQAGSQSCSVEQATNQVQIDDMLRRGKVAQVTIPLLTELQTIAGKAPDPHRPLAEQLDSHAVARFAEIGQQLKQMKLSAYVESAHARDANVVATAAMIAGMRGSRTPIQPTFQRRATCQQRPSCSCDSH